jgi:hypothetical protein
MITVHPANGERAVAWGTAGMDTDPARRDNPQIAFSIFDFDAQSSSS